MQNFNERHDGLRWGCTTQMKGSEPGGVKKGPVEVTQKRLGQGRFQPQRMAAAGQATPVCEQNGKAMRSGAGMASWIAPLQLLEAPC